MTDNKPYKIQPKHLALVSVATLLLLGLGVFGLKFTQRPTTQNLTPAQIGRVQAQPISLKTENTITYAPVNDGIPVRPKPKPLPIEGINNPQYAKSMNALMANNDMSRAEKIEVLLEKIEKSKNDDEKIAIINTFYELRMNESISILEYLADSPTESEPVKAAAKRALGELYLYDRS